MERGLVFQVNASAVITLAIDEGTCMDEAAINQALAEHLIERLRKGDPMDTIDSVKLISVEPL